MTLSISVALPTFDGARFVRAQLDSILRQSRPPDEIVVADDGSGDNTLSVVEDFARASSVPIHIVANSHIGLSPNLESALLRCSGDVIVLSDQDDLWSPAKVDAVANAFQHPSTTLWFSDAALIDEQDNLQGARLWPISGFDDHALEAVRFTPAGLRRLSFGGVWGCTMAFRRSVLDIALPFPAELGPPGQLYFHDGWLAVMAYAHGEAVADARPLTLYRKHYDQTSQALARATPDPSDGSSKSQSDARLKLELDRLSLILERLRTRHDRWGDGRDADVRELEEWYRHLAVRTSAPGFRRMRDIGAEVILGRYHKFERGLGTAAADFVGLRGIRR